MKKQGDVWHSHKVVDTRTGEELYCRGYASPSSPGFYTPLEQAQAFNDDDTIDWHEPTPTEGGMPDSTTACQGGKHSHRESQPLHNGRQSSVPTWHQTTQVQAQQARDIPHCQAQDERYPPRRC